MPDLPPPTSKDTDPPQPTAAVALFLGPASVRGMIYVRSARPRTGFTLVELIVAISVLTLMMILAARIFFDAQAGVQRGTQASQIIAESRTVSQAIAADVRKMNVFESKYGSNTPGFLLIAQRDFPGVRFPLIEDPEVDPSGWTVDRDGDGTPDEDGTSGDDDRMRSDQITFFREAKSLEAQTPGTDSGFDSLAKARYARVWIGHTAPSLGSTISLDPGNTDYDLASQLVLGRQALLLIEDDEATSYPNGNFGNVDSANSDATNRIANGGTTVDSATYRGEHDVLDIRDYFTAGVYDDGGTDPAAASPQALFRTPTHSVPPSATTSVFGNIVGAGGLPNNSYAQAAARFAYLPVGGRLQAATSLDNDFSGGIYTAEQIAQLHAALTPHVADFAIDFAADWIDNDGDGQPDNEPDRDGAGNIIWYNAIRPNPDDNSGAWPPATPANPLTNYDGIGNLHPTEPVTYYPPSTSWVSTFDGSGGTFDPWNTFIHTVNNHIVFVWSHTGDDIETPVVVTDPPLVEGAGKYWPYLLRFRFRLMDGKGEFRTIQTNPATGEDYPVVGRWFEQIVAVPRPQGLY